MFFPRSENPRVFFKFSSRMQELGEAGVSLMSLRGFRVVTWRTVGLHRDLCPPVLRPRVGDLRSPPGRSPARAARSPPSGFRYGPGQGPPRLSRPGRRQPRGDRPWSPRPIVRGILGAAAPYCNKTV